MYICGGNECRMCMSVIRKCMHMLIAYLVAFLEYLTIISKGYFRSDDIAQ